MRIVFMGTPEFAVLSLRALCEAGYEVIGAFTQPDRPKGRGNKVVFSPVKEYAVSRGIPVFQPLRIRKDGVEDLRALSPDLCVTAAFGQILSQEVLDIPRLGTINVHASLLPKHRGSAPVAWAIMNGDKKTGVTTMLTDKGIDTGDMLLQTETEICAGETCGELTERLSGIGASLLLDTLKALEQGVLVRKPQNEEDMTYDPMLTKEMGIIEWALPACAIVNRIHGLNPWPGCSTPFENGRLKLLKAEEIEGHGEPGEILVADAKNGLVIAAGENALRVMLMQAPGGKAMDPRVYLNGHSMTTHMILKEEV